MENQNLKIGYVYMLINITGTNRYIGSTFYPLEHRLKLHKSSYKHYKDGKGTFITSFKVFDEEANVNDVKIVLLEQLNCQTKAELRGVERKYIDIIRCVNKNKPNRNTKEYYIDNKHKFKQYYLDNKLRIKNYYNSHKNKLLQYQQEYYKRKRNQHNNIIINVGENI